MVLVGDAAATTDPTYGQGLSFALRAARVLRDELTNNSDWEAAGRHYAQQHRRSFHAVSYTHLYVYSLGRELH